MQHADMNDKHDKHDKHDQRQQTVYMKASLKCICGN